MTPLFDYDKYNLLMESYFPFEGYDFLYFDTPIDFYTLYRNNKKINTFSELEYIGEVLHHLNPKLKKDVFIELMLQVSDKSYGHSVRTYSEDRVKWLCEKILIKNKKPYCRRPRKVVFNPSRMLSAEEKRIIVNEVRSSRVNHESIYLAIEQLIEDGQRITYEKIGGVLGCSRQTISKKINSSLKELISFNNESMLNEDRHDEFISKVDFITDDKQEDKVKTLLDILEYRDFKKIIKNYFVN